MMNELRRELVDKLKIVTGNLFSDDTYERIMSNEDITINTLFADKEFQSKSIHEVNDIVSEFSVNIFKEAFIECNVQIHWLELKIDILEQFQLMLVEILNDYNSNKIAFNTGVLSLYEINKDKINISKELFIESMNQIGSRCPVRILNILYIEQNFVSTQSFDTNNILSFYS